MVNVGQTIRINTPTAPGSVSATLALAANAERLGWNIQNLDTTPLFVRLGTGASATSFHYVLKGGTGADDGLGGTVGETVGTVYTGIISVFSSGTARYAVLEH